MDAVRAPSAVFSACTCDLGGVYTNSAKYVQCTAGPDVCAASFPAKMQSNSLTWRESTSGR